MLIKIGVVLAAIPMALLALVAGTGLVVVDVREGGPSGHHLIVPVPLVLAQAASAFVPRHEMRVNLGEASRYLPVADEMMKALADGPDGELVHVEERDEKVRIAKVGQNLVVKVTRPGEDVSVTVPISMVKAVLADMKDGELTPSTIVGALREARFTALADVRNGDEHVRVTVW
jgi:3-dehydroquinate synthase class II